MRTKIAIVSIACLLMPPQAAAAGRADPETISVPGFRFVFHPDQKKIAAELAAEAPSDRKRIAGDLGADSGDTFEVRIADGYADYEAMQPDGYKAPSWSAGIAYPWMGLMVLQSREEAGGGPDALPVKFRHELSHLMLYRALNGGRAPKWLSEGLAIYHSGEWSFQRWGIITRAVAFNSFIGIAKLDQEFPEDVGRVHLAYAESSLFTAFLLGEYGPDAMHRFITDLARGEKTGPALSDAYGLTLDELQERWFSKARLKYAWLPVIASSVTLWTIASFLLVAGYLRKRRENRQKLEAMEAEDLILYSNAHGYSDDTSLPDEPTQPGERNVH